MDKSRVRQFQCQTCGSTEEWLHPANERCLDLWHLPKAMGVGRIADNEQAILVHFGRRPSDDDLRHLHEVLSGRVARSETPLVGWRPMDTAPKDGSKFLIVCATDEEPEIEVCDWFEMEDWHWERLSEDTYRKVVTGKRGQWNSNGHRATHWMPLPEVPLVHR